MSRLAIILVVVCLALLPVSQSQSLAAHDPGQSQSGGAYAAISAELHPDEQPYFDAFYNDLTVHGRNMLARIADRLLEGQRGPFAILLAYEDREAANSTLALFGSMDAEEFVRATRTLSTRDYRNWLALPAVLQTETISSVRAELDETRNSRCWEGFSDVEIGSEAYNANRPAGAVQCSDAIIRFRRNYVHSTEYVTNGLQARAGEAQWQAQLLLHGTSLDAQYTGESLRRQREWFGRKLSRWEASHTCGAVYIGDGYLLTAAHCIGGLQARRFFPGRRIRLGTQRIDRPSRLEEIAVVITHRAFNSVSLRNDIALLKLKRTPPGRGLRSARLPPTRRSRPPWSKDLLLTGWGFSWPTKSLAAPGAIGRDFQQPAMPWLRKGLVRRMNSRSCRAGAGEFCAGAPSGIGSCRGDSGGPLADPRTGILWGLVSHAKGCGIAEDPTTYVDVAYYLDWIARAKRAASDLPDGTKTRL